MERISSTTADGSAEAQLAFVYREAVRGLMQQQALVEAFNTRAGNLIFATAFAISLLGTRALSDGIGSWDWVAMALLLAVGAAVAVMLWPYYNYYFRFDPEDLLARFVDVPQPATMPAIHRALALQIKADMAMNWRNIRRIRVALQLALIFLLLDVLAWFVSIGAADVV